MDNERKSSISLAMFAFPLVFIIAAILVSFNAVRNVNVLKNTVSIEATVVSVEEDGFWDSEDFYHEVYRTKVNYEYEGQKYSNIDIGTLGSEHKIGDLLTIKISKDNPASPYTTTPVDVFFPILGALGFGVLGCFMLFKVIKWQIEDIKENSDKKILVFKLPTKGETIVGLVLAAIVALFIILQIYVLNGMIIGAVIFGFFLLIWVDCCLLK